MILPGTLLAVNDPGAHVYCAPWGQHVELGTAGWLDAGAVVLVMGTQRVKQELGDERTDVLVLGPGPVLGWVPSYRLDPVAGGDR